MKVVIEFEEITTRRTVVYCTDLQTARELFESGNRPHIRESWADDSVETDSRVDWDSGSYWMLGDPPDYMKEKS